MSERRQPVVKGVNEKGELIWGWIPMPLWQQAMFPVRYCGDFIAFWYKRFMFEVHDHESEADIPNMQMDARNDLRKPRKHHSGD